MFINNAGITTPFPDHVSLFTSALLHVVGRHTVCLHEWAYPAPAVQLQDAWGQDLLILPAKHLRLFVNLRGKTCS